MNLVQVKFIQELIISINLNFPANFFCTFCHLVRKSDDERICGLRVFLQIICLSYVNKKLILKRIGGNFELIEILVQLLIKKIGFLELFTFTGVANFARIPLTKFAMKDNTNHVTFCSKQR